MGERVISRAAHFGRVPESLLFGEGVTGEECRLYAYLTTCDYSRTGKVWPGRQTAAERLGWSIRSVDRWLAALEEHKAIRRAQSGAGRPMFIELLADVVALPDVAALPDDVASPATSRNRTPYRTRDERERPQEAKIEVNPYKLPDAAPVEFADLRAAITHPSTGEA